MILVTGGCGYIGSALLPKLLSKNVLVSDLKVYGQGGHAHYGDFAEIENLGMFDTVIHLAATTNNLDCIADPANCFENNLVKTINFVRKLRKDVRFIFASTSAVYGDQGGRVADLVDKDLAPYAASKLIAEKMIMEHIENSVCLRLGTVWGIAPFMRPHLLVHDMVKQAVREKRITISHPTTLRPFINIDDVGDTILNMTREYVTGIVNLGTERFTKIQLATMIHDFTGCGFHFEDMNIPIQDFTFRTTQLFKYYTSLAIGLQLLIHYYETHPDHP